jgi:hypothetical protein
MLNLSMTASALAGAVLVTMMAGAAQAVPALKPEIAKSEGVTLVGRGGGDGGPKFGGGGGGGPRMFGGGGGGPKFGGFSRGAPRVYGGGDGPRKFSGYSGRKFAGDFKPRFVDRDRKFRFVDRDRKFRFVDRDRKFRFVDKDRKFRFVDRDRKFRKFAVVGVPYVYGYTSYGCDWLYRRALVTGSPYWWNRYYACRDGDYY